MLAIGGLQKLTLIDFPGRLAATVFLCSCNFRCPWCYSRELVLPELIENQHKTPEKEFFDFLEERKGLLEGVVICGGEPTMNKDLPEFIKKIKKLGYLVKLDTNGSNSEMLQDLIERKLIDYAAMDVKLPKERYREVLGVDIKNIEESIKILQKGSVDYEFRSTIVPTIHTKEDVIEMARWIGGNPSTGSRRGRYYLQNFRSEKTIDPKFEKAGLYPDECLKEIQKAVAPFFEICEIR